MNKDDNTILKLTFIDVNGKEIKRKEPMFLSIYGYEISLLLLVYDISDRRSFLSLNSILKNISELFKQNENLKKILIGNKCDLEAEDGTFLKRAVSTEEAEKFAIENKFCLFEMSAREGGEQVNDMFSKMVEEVLPIAESNIVIPDQKIPKDQICTAQSGGCNVCQIF